MLGDRPNALPMLDESATVRDSPASGAMSSGVSASRQSCVSCRPSR